MLNSIVIADADLWQSVFRMLLAPLTWLAVTQKWLFSFFVNSTSDWAALGKCILLLLPVMLFVAAMWCTELSIYTIPFRPARVKFMGMMVLSWWDAARAQRRGKRIFTFEQDSGAATFGAE